MPAYITTQQRVHGVKRRLIVSLTAPDADVIAMHNAARECTCAHDALVARGGDPAAWTPDTPGHLGYCPKA